MEALRELFQTKLGTTACWEIPLPFWLFFEAQTAWPDRRHLPAWSPTCGMLQSHITYTSKVYLHTYTCNIHIMWISHTYLNPQKNIVLLTQAIKLRKSCLTKSGWNKMPKYVKAPHLKGNDFAFVRRSLGVQLQQAACWGQLIFFVSNVGKPK